MKNRKSQISMNFLLEPLTYAFMQRGLLAGTMVGILCAVIGTYVVLRGMAFLGDALAHAILPGIAIAYIFGGNLLIGALVAAVVVAVSIGYFSRQGTIKEDTAIGILFAGRVAAQRDADPAGRHDRRFPANRRGRAGRRHAGHTRRHGLFADETPVIHDAGLGRAGRGFVHRWLILELLSQHRFRFGDCANGHGDFPGGVFAQAGEKVTLLPVLQAPSSMTFNSFHDPDHLYFITTSICGWKHPFSGPKYADIALNSLSWLKIGGTTRIRVPAFMIRIYLQLLNS